MRDPRRRGATRRSPGLEELRFRKVIRAPLRDVYRWCTDYREDDDRLTNDIYHYRARIVLREPRRLVRVITTPGRDPNRNTDVEIITLSPPDRWRLEKMSVTDDESASYRLRRLGPARTSLGIVIHRRWKVARIPDRRRYRRLFNRVWDRYVALIESDQGDAGPDHERGVSRPRRARRPD